MLTVVLWLAAAMARADSAAPPEPGSGRPNILWIFIDDQSPWYGTYGDRLVRTPNIDALAREGIVFERAYAASPVCSPSRSAVVTGTWPIRNGTHDHRSGRVPGYRIHLPEGARTVQELFREAGYETYNAAKDDYNFAYRRSDLYSITGDEQPDTAVKAAGRTQGKSALERGDQSWKGPRGGGDWRDVPPGRPFFGQMAISGGKGVTGLEQSLAHPVDPAAVRVPPQYPDIPQVRRHIADHYNSILRTDQELGRVLDRLREDGLWGSTVIFLFADHGSDLPRSKEFCYVEGLHVPLIVAAPGVTPGLPAGRRRGEIVSLMDVAATSLALAGIPVPETMDSRDLFAHGYARDHVYSSADRMSNVIDRVRSVMGPRYHYIHNFMTDRPLMNWGHREMIALARPDASSFLVIRRLAEQGRLTPAQAAPYGPRIAEELYDLERDPDEVANLAGDPKYRDELAAMRKRLAAWIEDTDDKGAYARSEAAMREITERFPKSWLKSPEFRDLGD